jgi:hypothetical protein
MVEQAIDTAEGLGLPEGLRTWGELAKAYEKEVTTLLQRPTPDRLLQSQQQVAQLAAENNRLRNIITELTAERLSAKTESRS